MKQYIIPVILLVAVLVLGYFFITEKQTNVKQKTRLEACRQLVLDIDKLLAETDTDYSSLANNIRDLMGENISLTKASDQIQVLVDNRNKRDYRYNLTIDKYNVICFELK